MPPIKKETFLWEFSRIGEIPEIYTSVSLNHKKIENTNHLPSLQGFDVIHTTLFHSQFESTLVDEDHFVLNKIRHQNYSGAGISITYPQTFEGFMSQSLPKSIRKNLRRTMSRLESSFNITYKQYFGNITEEDLTLLLKTFKTLLEKRFHQKNMVNYFLLEWEKNVADLFHLINQQKASLFVTYDGDKPISISVNRHIADRILYSDSNAYDLDYSKYGLGHLDNYMILKWCIEHQYDFLDLGIGVVEYKKKWCNAYYECEYHVYHRRNSLSGIALATLEIAKIKAKNVIKELKIDRLIIKLKTAVKKSKETSSPAPSMMYSMSVLDGLNRFSEKNLQPLDLNMPETEGLRHPIYDYLFANEGHINDITLYKVTNQPHTYVFTTRKDMVQFILKK